MSKHKMSAAARVRIAALQKARWAKLRAGHTAQTSSTALTVVASATAAAAPATAALTKAAAEVWEIGNRAEAQVEKLGRKAMPFVLVAGAAFHLAKELVPHGQWEHLVEACSPLALRTVRARMQTVENALEKLGYKPERRAFEAIVFSSKLAKRHDRAVLETPHAKQLLADLNAIFAGRNAHQIELELGIRASKKPRELPPATEEDAEKRARDQAVAAVQSLRESVNTVRNLAEHLDKVHWNDVAWSCLDGLVHCLPKGWPIEVQQPNGLPRIELQQLLEQHVGPRRTA